MVNSLCSGLGGVKSSRLAGCVNSDARADPSRFLHCGAQFLFVILIWRVKNSVAKRVAARLVNFDEVRAFFYLTADGFDELVDVVGIVGVREHVLRGIESDSVFVSAENRDGVS